MVRRGLSARDIIDLTSFHGARALLAAASLGLFEALAGRRATTAAIARRIGTDPAATERLVAVLLGMRLLEREGKKVRLAAGARDLLTEEGSLSLSALLRHRAGRFKAWAMLEESIRTGSPVALPGEEADDPLALQAARARRDTARRWAPVLAGWLDLGGVRSLLLVGDGPGVFAYHFALQRPKLALTVVDGPASVAVGREFLRGRPEARRIRLVAGDPARDLPPGRFDAAFLSHALHAHSPEGVRRILRRVRKSLKPGGALFVRDRFLEGEGPSGLDNSLYDLQLLLTTREGRCHGIQEAADAVRAAGFRQVVVRDPGFGDDAKVIAGKA